MRINTAHKIAKHCFALALVTAIAPAWAQDANPVRKTSASRPEATQLSAGKRWWKVFGDARLDSLIDRVHAGSKVIEQAKARLAISRAAVKSGEAARLPAIGAGTSVSFARGPIINDAGGSGALLNADLVVGWDFDLFGTQTGNQRALRDEAVATEAEIAAATLLIEAQAVYSWMSRDQYASAARNAERAVSLQAEKLSIIADRYKFGLATRANVDDAQLEVEAARTRLARLIQARDQEGRQLAYLIGERDALPLHQPPPATANVSLPPIPANLPADILERRPDLIAARYRLLAADGRLRSQRKGWLPTIGLTGSGGVASTSLATLLSSAATGFGVAGLLAIPLFDGGRNRAAIDQRMGERDLARAAYEDAVLRALRDVNNQLQDFENTQKSLKQARSAAATSSSQYEASQVRFKIGSISRLQLLEMELDAASTQIARDEAEQLAWRATTNLILSMGGGWHDASTTELDLAPSS